MTVGKQRQPNDYDDEFYKGLLSSQVSYVAGSERRRSGKGGGAIKGKI